MKDVFYADKDRENEYKNVFEDRKAGGEALLDIIKEEVGENSVIVGIPNGGIEVAKVVSEHFDMPLKMVLSKKIPMKGIPFVGLGAVTENQVVYNELRIEELGLNDNLLEECVNKSRNVVLDKKRLLNEYILKIDTLKDKKVIIVDDGISSGYTMLGAIKEVSLGQPLEIVAVTPVIYKKSRDILSDMGIKVYYKYISDNKRFVVDDYYLNFDDIDDEEILKYKIRK